MTVRHLKKINIAVEPALSDILNEIANQEHLSISSLVRGLIADSLERREDIALSKIAALRDIEGKSLVNHDNAWN